MSENGNGTVRRVLGWVAGLLALIIAAAFTIQYQSATDISKSVAATLSSHEARISKVETCVEYMKADIGEIKELTKEIRRDQIRRERRER